MSAPRTLDAVARHHADAFFGHPTVACDPDDREALAGFIRAACEEHAANECAKLRQAGKALAAFARGRYCECTIVRVCSRCVALVAWREVAK